MATCRETKSYTLLNSKNTKIWYKPTSQIRYIAATQQDHSNQTLNAFKNMMLDSILTSQERNTCMPP